MQRSVTPLRLFKGNTQYLSILFLFLFTVLPPPFALFVSLLAYTTSPSILCQRRMEYENSNNKQNHVQRLTWNLCLERTNCTNRQRTKWRDAIRIFSRALLSTLTSIKIRWRYIIRTFAEAEWSTLTPYRQPGEEIASESLLQQS